MAGAPSALPRGPPSLRRAQARTSSAARSRPRRQRSLHPPLPYRRSRLPSPPSPPQSVMHEWIRAIMEPIEQMRRPIRDIRLERKAKELAMEEAVKSGKPVDPAAIAAGGVAAEEPAAGAAAAASAGAASS